MEVYLEDYKVVLNFTHQRVSSLLIKLYQISQQAYIIR